jgi:hypothetical protein
LIAVIKNFKEVIENMDIGRMSKELYDFLNLYCGFVAHYDINGFKAVYRKPMDFAEVFIKHFDKDHPYYVGIHPCHESPYKNTELSKAEIKREFERIVDLQRDQISRWAKEEIRKERYALYLKLKEEFEGSENNGKQNKERTKEDEYGLVRSSQKSTEDP